MINNLGTSIKKIRKQKNIKLKELESNILSISQLSKIERNEAMPSADKLIQIISKLNIQYDEFILFLDDEYLLIKSTIKERFSEFANHRNIEGLKELLEETEIYFNKYNDIYFKNVNLQILAILELIHSDNNFSNAKNLIIPIKSYLTNIDNWTYYELSLLCNCLFVFDIDEAVFFGNRAILSIEGNYSYYKNKDIACTLLNNLAIYTLDHPKYYSFSLRCSTMSEEMSFTSRNATDSLYAKMHQQLAYFKLKNIKFNKNYLFSLLETFQLLGWNQEYNRAKKFIKKHGVELE